ncbi:hypothetical protein [Streptomyces sp. NPDC049949]|uniref:hypothetical protein n=1 Tax=Streptomyces sp. NPDC049949 TaxID=3154627 RepID=UPI0034291874
MKTAAVAAAGGEQSAVAARQSHEKALGGGYAITGTGFATSSLFVGDAWPAAAYNPDAAPATRYDSHARRPGRPGRPGDTDQGRPEPAGHAVAERFAAPAAAAGTGGEHPAAFRRRPVAARPRGVVRRDGPDPPGRSAPQ